jgi:YesN/AraC family two-component response regulator
MHVQLVSMLQDVCTYYAAKFETNKSRMRQEELEELTVSIKQFVLDHYDNVNLNISLIGETFSMKSTYLSKLFKDQSGESLSDYMSRVRIEHVKRLLREEKATLQEVAGRCGFNDMNTFMRTFKKMEGITPGQYKKLS